MIDSVVVRPVSSWRDRRRFQHLPWAIYAPHGTHRDPNWVPPILAQERQLLGWGHHPFFDNAEIVTLLAERGDQTVGRLAVLVNHIHNRKYNEQRGFFGFFECVNDAAVVLALFETGDDWLRQRGMTTVRGPVNPSLNYTCGSLVDGFDRPPCFLMTYNPPYYAALLECCGFAKSQDLYAYEMDTTLLAAITERYKPMVLAALERSRVVIRRFDTKNYQQESETYLDIYNRSLEGTWGFTPLQPREARHIAGELRHVIVPQFAVFAEMDGQPIGALLALLDYNQILRKLNGRLFPFGFVRLLTGRRHITAARAMAMTMVPGYQNAGLAIVLMDNLVVAAANWGLERYEFSWVLESNTNSRGTLERLGTKITSTYRIYDKAL
jgi:GNAT superfamily N-acetyltransferase